MSKISKPNQGQNGNLPNPLAFFLIGLALTIAIAVPLTKDLGWSDGTAIPLLVVSTLAGLIVSTTTFIWATAIIIWLKGKDTINLFASRMDRETFKKHTYRISFTLAFMILLGAADGVFGMVLLKRAFLGISQDSYSLPFRILGLCLRIFALAGITLFAIRGLKREKLSNFTILCVLTGLCGGLWIFLLRSLIMTAYAVALIETHKQLYTLDFMNLGGALTLMAFSATVCTATGLLARAILTHRIAYATE